jgi:hypothetical protein
MSEQSMSPWGSVSVGAKYEPSRYVPAAELAKMIRKDLKEAQAAGTIPGKAEGFTYRVRSKSYSGGQSVSINVEGPGGEGWSAGSGWARRPLTIEDPGAFTHPVTGEITNDYGMADTWSDQAKTVGTAVNAIANAYVRADVDSMVDYFDVSCYMNVYAGASGMCLPAFH